MESNEKKITKKKNKQTAYERIADERRFKLYKKETINTARELFYGEGVIKKLNAAKTEYELSRIMCEARKNASDLFDLGNTSKSNKLSKDEKKLCILRKQAIKKAIDLEYSLETINKLKVAVSKYAIDTIMHRARMTGGK